MTDLLERLRRDDPLALEELAHELLPFVQASMLARTFEAPDAAALLQVFRDEVGLARSCADIAAVCSTVLGQFRARASVLPTRRPDIAQGEALARLARLEPLPVNEREVVIARFVERMPVALCSKHFALDAAALAAILSKGAVLLTGAAPAGADWATVPSLLDPDGEELAQLVELENAVNCLAVDVTAIESQPVVMAPLPVVKPGFAPLVPEEQYPSRVATQAFVDLPADVGGFIPSVVVSADLGVHPAPLPPAPAMIGVQPLIKLEESTQTHGVPLSPLWADPDPEPQTEVAVPTLRAPPPPEQTAVTVPRVSASPFAVVESTEPRGKPLLAMQADATDPNAKPLNVAPQHLGARNSAQIFNDEGEGYFADVSERTQIGTPLLFSAPIPFHKRLPSRWLFGGAVFCSLLGVTLYWGMLSYLQQKVQRPWKLVPVIAAGRDLPEGTKIGVEMLAVRAVPETNVTASVVRPGSLEYAIGQKLEFPLQAGDPLLWSHFDPERKNKRFDVIKRGRAYTIPMTGIKSMGGMLLPKEEIDLVMTITPTPTHLNTKAKTRAITLLQKVRVLAVGAVTTLNIGKVQRLSTDITLLLVPEEVEVLSLARRSGDITATLRNPEDQDMIGRGDTSQTTLLSGVRLKAIERRRGAMISNVRNQ